MDSRSKQEKTMEAGITISSTAPAVRSLSHPTRASVRAETDARLSPCVTAARPLLSSSSRAHSSHLQLPLRRIQTDQHSLLSITEFLWLHCKGLCTCTVRQPVQTCRDPNVGRTSTSLSIDREESSFRDDGEASRLSQLFQARS